MTTLRPTPTDGYPTPTSDLQAQTERILQDHLRAQLSLSPSSPSSSSSANKDENDETKHQPTLQKPAHVQFLLRNMVQGFPARYTSQDASQPWLIFWTLQGFSVLGVGLDEVTKKRTIDTLLALQHPSGGFAGGPGQFPHLLPTYAAVCALAISGPGGWDRIDREGLYNFFMSLKQPDGSFLVSHHGEVDVRGIYCLLAVATLLDLLTPSLLAGTPEFVAACQTYEGGFCNASFPDWGLGETRPPLGEAHGGYTFCATASWVLLQPYIRTHYPCPSTSSSIKPRIDVPALLRWCVQMQGSPTELGGFRGRTNKLVDGCYSWWVGGCVGLVEGLLISGAEGEGGSSGPTVAEEKETEKEGRDEWDDVDDSLFDRRALQEYVLYAAQHSAGGLVDKPPKGPDAYHTLYCLSGLSAAQHHVLPSSARRTELLEAWVSKDKPVSSPSAEAVVQDKKNRKEEKEEWREKEELRREAFVSALSWVEEEGTARYVGGAGNRVNATHPLTNLTVTHVENMMVYFYGQAGVPRRGVARDGGKKTV
ncbi:terpenoid cyclases/protein prenyltransferase alpha-alpha toroid [Irpex lacteus]|nr:terpenoid cyclases/protein prenyltransferase alpha-alpha toroid [Irpex lacteus]